MAYGELKKAINSDLNKPLDILLLELLTAHRLGNIDLLSADDCGLLAIQSLIAERLTKTRMNNIDLLSNDDCGLSAIRHLIDERLTEDRIGYLEELMDAVDGLPALKYNQYISDIKTYGTNSFCMRPKNRHLFQDLLANSMTIYGDDTIHETIVNAMTNDEMAIMLEDDNAGDRLNAFYNTTIFPKGSAAYILQTGLTSAMINIMDTKINTYLQNSIGAILSASSGVGAYLNSQDNLGNATLAGKATLAQVMADSGCVTAVFNNASAVNKYMGNSVFRNAFKASTTAMTAVNGSTTAINNIKNSKYGKENVKTAASTNAVSLLVTAYCGVAEKNTHGGGSNYSYDVWAFARAAAQYVKLDGTTVALGSTAGTGGGSYGSISGSGNDGGIMSQPYSASTHNVNQIVKSATQVSKSQSHTYTNYGTATCTATGTVTYIPL